MSSVINSYAAVAQPILVLRINDEDADDVVSKMVSFEMEKKKKHAEEAKFVIADPTNSFINDPRFTNESVWSFRFGYPNLLSQTQSMKLLHFEPVYDESGMTTLTVTLRGQATSLIRSKSGKNWGSIATSDIAKNIAKKHGLKAVVEFSDDKVKQPYIQRNGVDDYAFLTALADEIDFDFFIDTDTLYYRSNDTGRGSKALAVFSYGTDEPTLLKSFSPTIKTSKPSTTTISSTSTDTGQNKQNKVNNKNYKGKQGGTTPPPDPKDPAASNTSTKKIDKEGRRKDNIDVYDVNGNLVNIIVPGDPSETEDHTHTPENSPQKVAKMANARKRDFLEQAVQASATFIGSPIIRPHANFIFQGIDKRLSGAWYCVTCRHTFDASGYHVTAEFHRGTYTEKKGKSKKITGLEKSVADIQKATGKAISKAYTFIKTTGAKAVKDDTKVLSEGLAKIPPPLF